MKDTDYTSTGNMRPTGITRSPTHTHNEPVKIKTAQKRPMFSI